MLHKNDEVTASNDTLFDQASYAAESYLKRAVSSIDEQFGKGFAKTNPELVSAYMQTCAADLSNSMSVRAAERTANALNKAAEALDGISNNIQFSGGS